MSKFMEKSFRIGNTTFLKMESYPLRGEFSYLAITCEDGGEWSDGPETVIPEELFNDMERLK